MIKLIVKIDRSNAEVYDRLLEYGSMSVLSVSLGLYTINTSKENMRQIAQIPGVLSVERNRTGLLQQTAM